MDVGLAAPPFMADIFITEELGRRPRKSADYLREKVALQDLAGRMLDRPEDVLPRFVELAMDMAEGVAAGISLYEDTPAPGVFRWKYLRGALARFEGATTPRNFSPCGITLDRNAPVLAAHPERVYSWIADARITVPEVLLVPLYLGGTAPLGTLWVVSDTPGHFDSGHARIATELASFVGIALRMVQVEERLQRALEDQKTLTREMSHRLKNVFSITEGMIRFTAKGASSKDEMTRVLSGRLQALASAHSLVRRDFADIVEPVRTSDLGAVVRVIMRPHGDGAGHSASRIAMDGPPIPCGERTTNGMALVLHELATNAAKHGALRAEDGHVDVAWTEDKGQVVIRWIERGGPEIVARPTSQGFGSTLVHAVVVEQFEGSLSHDWQPTGLSVTITLPAESLST